MFRLLKSIAGVSMYIICISSCTDFSYQSSNYEVRMITASLTWLDASTICKSSGGQLVSLNTADETAALLTFLRTNNCQSGRYAIGLSRQAGLDRDVSANWIWETGQRYEGQISWDPTPREPNTENSVHCGVRITSGDGMFYDYDAKKNLYTASTIGYICEKHVSEPLPTSYFQTKHPLAGCRHNDVVGTMSALCLRCALQCFREKECLAFKYDDEGCQLKSDLSEDKQHYYTRV